MTTVIGNIWRPILPNSIDGKPLAFAISDLLRSFPYERLPTDSHPFVSFLLRPSVPFMMVFLYLASKPALKSFCVAFGITGKSKAFAYGVALHNLALAVFSFVVFINSWPVVLSHLATRGWEATYCDRDGSLWGPQGGLGAWATVFYISKYYEFADTWVLIMKGKKPSLLQTYHHSGIALTMWGAVVSQSAWIMSVVLLNSGIHTLMYSYFFIKTLYPKMVIPWARHLTMAQIGQFITGITFTIGVQVMGERCDSASSRLVLLFIQLYAVGLIILFTSFASKKYKKI